jgi:hypothetical protein
MVGEAVANRHHFSMCGRVAVRPPKIASAGKHLPVTHNDCAERKIALPGFIEGDAHEPFIVGCRVRGGNQTSRRQQYCGRSKCGDDSSPAVLRSYETGIALGTRSHV